MTSVSRPLPGILATIALVLPASIFDSAPASGGDPVDGPVTGAPTLRERVPEGLVLQLDVDPTPGIPVTLAVPLDGALLTLDLLPHSVRSPNYQVLAQVDDGSLVQLEPGPVRTLRGVVAERPGSFVAASLVEGGIEAMIDLPEVDGRYWVQPFAEAGEGFHIVYHDEQVAGSPGTCGFEEGLHDLGGDDLLPLDPAAGQGGVAGGDCFWFAEIACDADFQYYSTWGSSTVNVENQINSIINAVNDQYERDVNISHQISTILIRTSPTADPYSSTTSPSGLLNEFRNYWNINHNSIQRDLAELFTGRNLADPVIGIAFAAQICTSSAYSVVQQISVFSCRTDLSAHEMGHNWAANHCSCSGFTMNSSLTCANQFHPTSTAPEIIAYRNTRQFCLFNACVPANDDCGNATIVEDGSHSFTTAQSSTDGPGDNLCSANGSNQIDNDVWFRYQLECDGDVTVGVCNSNFNTRLAVYESFCPTAVNQAIACNDDSCSTRSELTFTGSGGTDYLIRVGGFDDATGSGFLSIQGPLCIPAPPNDDCGSAITIQEGSTAFTTVGATTDGPEESGCGSTIENDVWYRFLAPCDGTATISLCDSSYDTVIAAYGPPCPGSPNTAIACNDDACGEQSVLSFDVVAGSIYRVRVGGANGAFGNGTLNLSCGDLQDCNGNGIADDQDIADGTAEDCNGNAIPDSCDIDDGTSTDANGNGIPDECEPDCPTDVDGNSATDVDDLVAVILAWGSDDPAADVDGSGLVDVDDLVMVILAWGPCEP